MSEAIPSEGWAVPKGEVLQGIVTLSRFQDIVNLQGKKLRQGLPIRTDGRNRRQNRAYAYSIGVMATSGGLSDGDRKFAAEAHSNRKKRKRFPHGNYTGYYFTRYGSEPASVGDNSLRPGDRDPRLSILQGSWFEGKKCLDVGCNEGNLTLAIVRRFRPRQMVGVDIDEDLVELARDALADEISFAVENAKRRADEGDTSVLNGGATSATALGGSMKPRPLMLPSLHDGSIAPANVSIAAEKTKTSPACGDEEPLKGKEDYVKNGGRGKDEQGNSYGIDSSVAGIVSAASSVELANAPRSETDKAEKGVESVAKAGLASTSKTVVSGGGNEMHVLRDAGTKSAVSERGERVVQHSELDAAGVATSVYSGDAEKASFLAGCAVSFRCEDFAREAHSGPGGYDVICLFSVVKWMHLNGGDEAVKAVFRKTHQLLRPGGRLILEPQPKKSYRKSARQHGTLEARANVNKIRLWPSDFPHFLTAEVGFRTWEEVGMPGEGIGSFAQRNIHVFLK